MDEASQLTQTRDSETAEAKGSSVQRVLDAVNEAIDAMVITQRLFDLSPGHILMQRCRALTDEVWRLEKAIELEKQKPMKSPYELIKDYLVQKGYEGPNLEQAAWQATVKVEAIRTGIDPLLTTPVPAAIHATGDVVKASNSVKSVTKSNQ